MKKIVPSLKKILWLILGCIAFFILNQFLNMTFYNPAIAVPAFRWLVNHHILKSYEEVEKSNDVLYPIISIDRLEHHLYFKTRASVIGTVTDVERSSDGDWHVNLRDGSGQTLVLEIAPEYPILPPPLGVKVKAWGVTRYDLEHRWWELHPVWGWEVIHK